MSGVGTHIYTSMYIYNHLRLRESGADARAATAVWSGTVASAGCSALRMVMLLLWLRLLLNWNLLSRMESNSANCSMVREERMAGEGGGGGGTGAAGEGGGATTAGLLAGSGTATAGPWPPGLMPRACGGTVTKRLPTEQDL